MFYWAVFCNFLVAAIKAINSVRGQNTIKISNRRKC